MNQYCRLVSSSFSAKPDPLAIQRAFACLTRHRSAIGQLSSSSFAWLRTVSAEKPIENQPIPRRWIACRLRFIDWSDSPRERNYEIATETRNNWSRCSRFQSPNQHTTSIRRCEDHRSFETCNYWRNRGEVCNDISFRTGTHIGSWCWNSMPRWYFTESDAIDRCKFFSPMVSTKKYTNDPNSNAHQQGFELECLDSPIKPVKSSTHQYWSIWYSRVPSDGKAEHWNAFRRKLHLQCWTNLWIHFFSIGFDERRAVSNLSDIAEILSLRNSIFFSCS